MDTLAPVRRSLSKIFLPNVLTGFDRPSLDLTQRAAIHISVVTLHTVGVTLDVLDGVLNLVQQSPVDKVGVNSVVHHN